jgi:FAD:protein FMN transferase
MAAERRFRAMGSDAHLLVVGGPTGLVDRAHRRIDDLERRWSRFRPDSEVSRLTQHAGSAVPVSSETVLLVGRSIDAWRLTGGAFDPTVLGDVLRAGYDRSFEDREEGAINVHPTLLRAGCADIEVTAQTVALPPGTGFDPGGIGKGLAGDLVAAEMMAAGAAGVCVGLGGDVRVTGLAPDGQGWTIAVEHPWFPWPLTSLGVGDGAVATSTTLLRRWRVGDTINHHLIDPSTGLPSDSDLTFATVVAGEAWIAEVQAKTVLLRGSMRAFDLIDGTGIEGLAMGRGGRVLMSSGFTRFTGGLPQIAA